MLIGVFTLSYAMGKTVDKSGRIEYSAWHNGEVDSNRDKLIVEYTDSIAKSWVDQSGKKLIPEVPQQVNYLAYQDSIVIRQATFQDGQSYFTTNHFRTLDGFEPEGDPVKILGYKCQKYVGSSFSNKIELWVTTKTGLQATPMLYFPFPGAVVMRYVRNGNSGWEATNIEFFRKNKVPEMIPDDMEIGTDDVEFSRRLANAFVKNVPVFEKQQINWGGKIENPKGEYTDSFVSFCRRYSGGETREVATGARWYLCFC